MRILISAASRTGKRVDGRGAEGDGCIYVCQFDHDNLILTLHRRLHLPPPQFLTQRMGARGIASLPNGDVVCANHDSLILLDKSLAFKRQVSTNQTADIHDVEYDDSTGCVNVCCSTSDSVQMFTPDLLSVNEWRACDHQLLSKHMETVPKTPIVFKNRDKHTKFDFRHSFAGDGLHINGCFRWQNEFYIASSTLAKFFNTQRGEFLDLDLGIHNPQFTGGRIHSYSITGDVLTMLNTHHGLVEQYNLRTRDKVGELVCRRPSGKSTGLPRTKHMGFLRGLHKLSDHEYLAGQIGPTVFYCNFKTGVVTSLADFEQHHAWAVYGITSA